MTRKSATASRKSSNRQSLAARADRHHLYEQSVQNTDTEYHFLTRVFRKLRGRPPRVLREDFCGTAKMCCEWVSRHADNRACGVDLDARVLDSGRARHVAALHDEQQARVTLFHDNVLSVQTPLADIVVAMNFSYQTFKDRDTLRRYFARVRDSLGADGLFILDAFGGYEVYNTQEETTRHKGFVYVWDQAQYNPITGHARFHIHFRFADGSELKRAFTYDWRLWSLPELRELLTEAGFSQVDVYWEGTNHESNEGNGVYRPTLNGTADPAWVCFLVAQR